MYFLTVDVKKQCLCFDECLLLFFYVAWTIPDAIALLACTCTQHPLSPYYRGEIYICMYVRKYIYISVAAVAAKAATEKLLSSAFGTQTDVGDMFNKCLVPMPESY